jgi:hypothetical protein
VDGLAGTTHKEEAEKFAQAVEGEIDFHAMTYQTLVKTLKKLSNGSHQEYFDYLERRYQLS